MKGFASRIEREIRMLSEYTDPINIVHRYSHKQKYQAPPIATSDAVKFKDDPSLDAWRGAARFANDKFSDKNYKKFMITKHEYEECGDQYL